MKILLVLPAHRSYVVQPNLGLGYLASAVRKAGHEAVILDCVKDKIGINDFTSIMRTGNFDVVGIHMFSQDYSAVKDLSKLIKQIKPEIYTIAGGPHPTGNPEEMIKDFPDIDFIFCGEGEEAIPLLLNYLSQGIDNKSALSKIAGLYWKDKSMDIENSTSHPVIKNLDSLQFPAWDLMRPDKYPEAPHGAFFKQFPTAPIIITRGCPFECTFCAGARYRHRKRSIGNVMEEIRFLDKEYGVKEFLIEDENFTLHRELVQEFCESLMRADRRYTWSCPTGISLLHIDLKILQLMEKAGCHSVSVGVEFGSQRIHDLTKKKLTIDLIREKLNLLSQANIRTTGFFLLGIPGETLSEMKETVEFALSLPLHRIQVNNFMPLPGSQIWRDLKNAGKLKDVNYDDFFVHDVAYVSAGIKKRDLKRLQQKAYLKFYFRWKIIKNILNDIRSFSHFKYLIKRFLDALS